MSLADSLRPHFFLPDDAGIEFRAFTHGLMPRRVPELLAYFAEDWQRLGVDAWNAIPNRWTEEPDGVGWWNLPEWLADRFISPLLGAPQGTCILLPNVHWIVQCLLSSPEPFQQRRAVVTTRTEFPSVSHSVFRWADRLSLNHIEVPDGADGMVDAERLLASVDEDTALVILSHVGFTTGELLTNDFIREVATLVHERGGLLALDGYHATASVDVDVAALGVDLYFGGLLKEACGSTGNAYLYVRPGLELTPLVGGWVGDGDPFTFGPRPVAHPAVRRRFMGGTPAIAPLYHAIEGLRLLLGAGIERVREDSLSKTARCIELADRLGLSVRSPLDPAHRGPMFILNVPQAEGVAAALKREGVYVDSRRNRLLRMAPFVWNTEEEIDQAFEILSRVLRQHRSAGAGALRGPVP